MRRCVILPTMAAAALVVALEACLDNHPVGLGDGERPATVLVSDTAGSIGAVAHGAAGALSLTSQQGITYVSLPAGAAPNGILAIIENRRSGDTAVAPLSEGGFDPVAIAALAGDALQTRVVLVGGGTPLVFASVVPSRRRPKVVRTIPARGKTGVPLNARIVIVFSEPMDPQSLTTQSIQLRGAAGAIGGAVAITDAAGLVAQFTPAVTLAANTTHQIVVTQDARDLDGDRLEGEQTINFTTGATLAFASVTTDQPAMFRASNGEIRVFDLNAIQHGQNEFSGRFAILYPGSGARVGGRVSCFGIGPGRRVWMAGVVDDGNPVGVEFGWRLVDNGPALGLTPDQLSLAHPLDANGLGNASSFCQTMPTFDPALEEEIALRDIEAGEIALRFADEPPPPPASDMSLIAFAAAPNGGIRLMRADGLGSRALTFGNDWNPSWSPDGRRIAFDGNSDIYTINADGTGLKPLTTDQSFDADPEWSPDATKLAFYRNGGIYMMNASDGSGVRLLTEDGAHPSWSPDGAHIAFWSGRSGKWGVYVIGANGSDLRRLTSDTMNASNPSWSPDGKSIAFQGDNGIYVIGADGSNLKRVALGGQTAAWSHDSKMIIYEWYGLRVINADGSGMTVRGRGFTPAWSPAGSIPPLPTSSLQLEIAGGNHQIDTVLATLPRPLSVRLVRDDGSPAAGVRVYWQVLLQDGTPNTPWTSSRSSLSDAAGIASVRYIMGAVAGTWPVHAFVTDGSAHNAGVEFVATARGGTAVLLEPFVIAPAFGSAGSTLEHFVIARDAHGPCADPGCGNLVTGARITWEVPAGGGSIAPREDTTATGRVPDDASIPVSRTVHTLPATAGQVVVTATAPATPLGLPRTTLTAIVFEQLVRVSSSRFVPDTVAIESGKTVHWLWDDTDDFHDVTFEDDPAAGSGTKTYGEWFARTFTAAPRTIRYRCTFHSTSFTDGHVGVVIVQ